MVDAHDPNGGDDELAPRHILESLAVPELPYDFTDRVMGSLHAAPRMAASRPWVPWTIAAMCGAVALAATAVLVTMWPPREPAPRLAELAPAVVALPSEAPARGHLVLEVVPRDASVRIDGVPLDGPSPFVATNLVPGRHAIAIEHDGHSGWTRELDVPAGKLDLSIALPADTPSPSRAEAPALEEPATPRTPIVSTRRSPADAPRGPKLKDPFGGPEPTARADAPSELTDPFGGTGVLRIGTTPGSEPAFVEVDGKRVGTTPIANVRVTPGRHEVRWLWAPRRYVTRTVDVEEGEIEIVKAGEP